MVSIFLLLQDGAKMGWDENVMHIKYKGTKIHSNHSSKDGMYNLHAPIVQKKNQMNILIYEIANEKVDEYKYEGKTEKLNRT